MAILSYDRKLQYVVHRFACCLLYRCSVPRLKSVLLRLLPVLSWLPKYSVRDNLLCDVISGVRMAFALLANLPPVNGLYSSFFPLIPYFFMGTVHQMVPGTFAVLSMMVGTVCLSLAPESDFSHFNVTLNITEVDTEPIYLSQSFVRGFMTAAGLQILVSVLKYVFGIKIPPYSGPLAVVYVHIISGLPKTNIASLLFALCSAVVLIAVKELSARYRQKFPFPVSLT
uniref:SLC26A/SulP transporter domain-containing protein n=1 Tax=Neogobius melanostomus TaxID=47308 RepID=A0A8C6T7D7_9GOBI